MKIIKIAFIAVLAISFCSFAYNNSKEEGREELFKNFLDQFEIVKVPKILILKTTAPKFDSNQSIQKKKAPILGSKYANFLPSIVEGSRMGPSTYAAEVILEQPINNYNTIIYSETRSYNYNLKSYTIATFDKNGIFIDSEYLAQLNGEGQVNITATADMHFFIQGLENSELGSRQLIETAHLNIYITDKGQIAYKD